MLRRSLGAWAVLFILLAGVGGCSPAAPVETDLPGVTAPSPLLNVIPTAAPLASPSQSLPSATASSPLRNVIPTAEPLATPAQSLPAAMPAPTDSVPDANTDPAAASARDIAATALGLSAAVVTVVKIEQVDWSDSSLGCPQPGYLYAQVITPGYRATVEIDSKTYFVHMDASGQGMLCLVEP